MKDIDISGFVKRLTERHKEHQAKRDAVQGTNMTFVIEPYEQQILNEWRAEHNKTCKYRFNDDGTPVKFPGGAAGGSTSYEFTPTGIGVAIFAKCTCGEEINLTDYESW